MVQNGAEGGVDASGADDGYFLPELPGLEKDFWEGPEWDGFGFFVQYMWAFGIGFAVLLSLSRSLSLCVTNICLFWVFVGICCRMVFWRSSVCIKLFLELGSDRKH